MGESSDTPYSRLEETDYSKTVSVPSPHWRSKYNFIWIFQNNVFCSCVHFSIVMPSIYAYVVKHGGSDYFFASVLFIYSLGELLGSLLFGYIHNYLATRTTMQSGLSLGLIGSVMYFTADYVGGTAALVLIFLARMLQGLWSGG
jgi:MFS family permease